MTIYMQYGHLDRCVHDLFVEELCSWSASGLAQLDNELFLLNKSSPELYVYDAVSFLKRGTVIIPMIYRNIFVDMVACSFHHCLYIASALDSTIHRLKMPSEHKRWKVDGLCSSAVISVTSSHHLLVYAGGGAKELKLFSTDGELYHTVELHPDLVNVTSAVELMPGQYVVTHGRDSSILHRVCVVNSEGEILHTFGGFKGSHPKLLNSPSDVAVDKDGFVYVDDENNDRLFVLTHEMDYVHCMPCVFQKCSRGFRRRMKLDTELGCICVLHVVKNIHQTCYYYTTMFKM